MPVGVELYLAFGVSEPLLGNPDSLIEDYDEFRLFLCDYQVLKERNGVVEGWIGTDTVGNSIEYFYQYPTTFFEDRLTSDCAFNKLDIQEDACSNRNFQVYPNPITGTDDFTIKWLYYGNYIKSIDVYSLDGKKMYGENQVRDQMFPKIRCDSWANGLYIVRIESEKRVVIRKVILNRER